MKYSYDPTTNDLLHEELVTIESTEWFATDMQLIDNVLFFTDASQSEAPACEALVSTADRTFTCHAL